MSFYTKPDCKIRNNPLLKPSIIAKLEDLVCRHNRFLSESDATFRHLAMLPEEEVASALKGSGIRKEWIEDALEARIEAQHWMLPIGERVPMAEGWEDTYKDDSELLEKRADYINTMQMAVYLAPTRIRALSRILEQSDHPMRDTLLDEMASAFEWANEQMAVRIDQNPPPPIDWVESEGGYYIRDQGTYSPMTRVYRRWDAAIGIFDVTIIRSYNHPGTGAYQAYLDIDDRGERITGDQSTFDECVKALWEKLKLRVPMVSRPGGFVERTALPGEQKKLDHDLQEEQDGNV